MSNQRRFLRQFLANENPLKMMNRLRPSEADLGLLQHPLTIITKHSILDVAEALDPPLTIGFLMKQKSNSSFDFTYGN